MANLLSLMKLMKFKRYSYMSFIKVFSKYFLDILPSKKIHNCKIIPHKVNRNKLNFMAYLMLLINLIKFWRGITVKVMKFNWFPQMHFTL